MPLDEPNMSDTTLLVSVEDLINIAMGPEDKNIVNFKVVQTVLHILARQQRMLQQRVEIRITEVRQESPPPTRPHKKAKKGKESEGSSPSSSPPPPKKRVATPREEKPKDITKDTTKVDKEKDLKRKEEKEKAKLEKEKEKLEKEKEKQLRAQEKAQLSARKEQEKAEKAQQKELEKAQKEKEKAERLAEKEKEKAERLAEKEKEKAEKMSGKEKEKAEKAAEKEREKAEKAERKERERAEKEAAKAQKEKERGERSPSPAATKEKKKSRVEAVPSINISEVERGKEKVLVVEKGPTTRSDTRGRPIDVVTQSQFALLEATVRGLAQQAAPPALRLPDDQSLKTALARGSASLTDTMQAMQVDARVKAAEAAIARMAELLTQLAAAGAVPPALADRLADAKRDAERTLTSDTDDTAPVKPRPSTARKSVAIDPMVKTSALARPSTASASAGRSSLAATPRASLSTVMARSSVSQPSSTVTAVHDPKVTRGEMEDIIKSVKDELWKNMNSMTTKATTAAETAAHTAKAVAERLETALKLDGRISTLHALVADYAAQLTGFDAGLTTQMQSFQEQMMQIRGDLAGGLKLLDSVNNNAETAAVMELTERYEEQASELERTVAAHRALADFQGRLGDELRSLVECVEMLREQKADRDEVIDGLRDKADMSRLAGLLTEAEFARARAELQRRLDVCHDKFRRQDGVWMGAIKELLKTTDLKAEIIDLLSMREDTQRRLRELHDKLRLLAAVLGEPKAALLTRQLARDGSCGACGAAALMGPRDPAQGVPPAVPALRAPPPPPEPCLRDLGDWMPPEPPDDRHMCQRWCGGSHTLVSGLTTRERAPPLDLVVTPTRKFADYGRDGRLYMLEEELQPCKECNVVLEAERGVPVGEEGAGDQGA